MNHLGNYTDPSKESLAYQMEYVFGGRDNDIDNLKSVASKLLFIREGVNFACLMADNVKRTEAQALAAAIASGISGSSGSGSDRVCIAFMLGICGERTGCERTFLQEGRFPL